MNETPKSKMPSLTDIFFLLGLGLVAVGAWMAYRPAGLIVPGVVLLLLAVRMGAREMSPPKEGPRE